MNSKYEYPGGTDVSCSYLIKNTQNVITFYYYPARGTIEQEIEVIGTPILKKYNPENKIITSKNDFTFNNKAIIFNKIEAGPDSQGISNSISFYDENNKRFKIRMTNQGDASIHNKFINDFGTLQTEAFETTAMCVNYQNITKKKAKTSSELSNAMIDLMLASVILDKSDSTKNTDVKCNLFMLNEYNDQKNIIFSYSNNGTNLWSFQDFSQNNLPILKITKTFDDNKYTLIGHNKDTINFYHRYDKEPNVEQVYKDLENILNGKLPIIASINSKDKTKQITIHQK